MVKFSVIIATRKVSDFLKESISAIKGLNYNLFEVLIVTDAYEHFDFEGDTRFTMLDSQGDGNPGLKRNIAAAKAKGDILVFLDDDAYPTATWLTEAANIFKDPRVFALGGPAITPINPSILEQASGYILKSTLSSGGTTYRHTPKKERQIDDYPTVNLFVRKTAFEQIGGFGTEFWPGEDTKLCLDLVKLYGRKFLYSPKPIVYHHRRKVFIPHLKQISRYGKHRGQYARVFPETSRVPSYFVPSLFVIGLVFGPATLYIYKPLFFIYSTVICSYLILVAIESAKAVFETKKPVLLFYVSLGIILTHIVYGINFVAGYIKRPRFIPKAVDQKSGNYSEG